MSETRVRGRRQDSLPVDGRQSNHRPAGRFALATRMAVMLAAVGLVLGGVYGFQVFKAGIIKQVMASLANPPQTVSTVTAAYGEWQPRIAAVGTLRAVNGARLSLQPSGIVSEISFHSGDDVRAGQVLLRLRSDDDTARLHALEAQAELARINFNRDMKLFGTRVVSQSTLETDAATLKNNQAQVAAQQAVVDQKILRAPFAGRIGLREVDLGQYLAAGTGVASLQALDPLYVDFFLPQQALAKVKVGQAVAARVDTWPGRVFAGRIDAINPEVDAGSRNVQVRATLANPGHALLPGMFATLDIDTGAPRREVTLPQTAISYNPYGDTVYLVVAGGRDSHGHPRLVARQSFVTTGEARGDQVAVLKGVKAGDTVVSAGQIKLRNGTEVLVSNAVQPENDPDPHPVDR